MGQKDLTQKNLEEYPDVFADCVNALLYQGRPVLEVSALLAAPTETLYPEGEEKMHSQLQDVSRYEMQGTMVKRRYTLENQTAVDRKMALRESGYKGAIYRLQYQGKASGLYPVISLVLYWGEKPWKGKRSLKELLGSRICQEDSDYVDDVRLRVFEMQHLPCNVREKFHSDMRVVVDCLAEGENYEPGNQRILHVDAFLRLMRAVTGDTEYELIARNVTEQEREEGIEMTGWMKKYWNDGMAEGISQGVSQGIAEGEDRMARLAEILNRANRWDDFLKAMKDIPFRNSLFQEYHLL